MELIKTLIAQNAKAIAAFVTSVVVSLLARGAVDVPADVQVAINALVVSLVVWLVANTPKRPTKSAKK